MTAYKAERQLGILRRPNLLAVGASIEFSRFECVGLQQFPTGTIITKLTLS